MIHGYFDIFLFEDSSSFHVKEKYCLMEKCKEFISQFFFVAAASFFRRILRVHVVYRTNCMFMFYLHASVHLKQQSAIRSLVRILLAWIFKWAFNVTMKTNVESLKVQSSYRNIINETRMVWVKDYLCFCKFWLACQSCLILYERHSDIR